MTYSEERDRFIAEFARNAAPSSVILARKLLRAATTLHRLAEAQCNGDWPYDNGERPVTPCPVCESGTVKSQLVGKDKACPDCRTAARVRRLLAGSGWLAQFQGDPRGCVLYIVPDDGQTNERYTGNHPKAIGVPGRY